MFSWQKFLTVHIVMQKFLITISNSFKFFLFLFYLTVSKGMMIFKSKNRIPKTFVYSLSAEQVYSKSNPRELQEFFREPRFNGLFDTSNVFIECRSWKTFFNYSNSVVFDATFSAFKYHIKMQDLFYFLKYASISFMNSNYLSSWSSWRVTKKR